LSAAPPPEFRKNSMDGPVEYYLDLMKRSVADFTHIDDPLANYELYHPRPGRARWKEWVLSTIQKVLYPYHIHLVELQNIRTEERALEERVLGRVWPVRAHTMIGMKRLDNLRYCVEQVMRDGVPGDLIETGAWRGGACIFMRAILKAHGDTTRTVWVADSFSGLPPPNAADYPADMGDKHFTQDALAVSQQTVERNFANYGLLDEQVRFLKGWFKDTLPDAPIERLAVMRLDGDMYESTIQALEALYPRLSPGGFVIIDDYMLAPCAKAVGDFRAKLGITDEIHDIDGFGVYWRRSP
jgi:O-methyltransferase